MKTITMIIVASLFALGTFSQVKQKDESRINRTQPGKKHFVLKIDDDIREYYVNVPSGYNDSRPIPVVIMLHGSGGDGLKFYNISGWVKVGDNENIITVFPSSWKYDCVIDDSIKKPNAEKWNDYGLVVCNNNKKRDDVKFLSTVIEEVKQKYAVDTNRIYLVGFSNGGNMAARCAIELSDKLAAVVSCAGALPPDTTLTPLRKLPLLLQIGSKDQKLMANLGTTDSLPMDIPQLLASYPLIQSVINSYINSFGLQTNFTPPVGDPQRFQMITYLSNFGLPDNILTFVEVKNLTHQYPNGLDRKPKNPNENDHPLVAAKVHWDWMKNFRLH